MLGTSRVPATHKRNASSGVKDTIKAGRFSEEFEREVQQDEE